VEPVEAGTAAEGGHLEGLQWVRQYDCPWDSHTCIFAARSGQLEVLQWVREHDATGEVWSERRVRCHATRPRREEVLAWLDDIRAP
jgi:hypothetical protein